jgi:hypothetical protein
MNHYRCGGKSAELRNISKHFKGIRSVPIGQPFSVPPVLIRRYFQLKIYQQKKVQL